MLFYVPLLKPLKIKEELSPVMPQYGRSGLVKETSLNGSGRLVHQRLCERLAALLGAIDLWGRQGCRNDSFLFFHPVENLAGRVSNSSKSNPFPQMANFRPEITMMRRNLVTRPLHL